MLSKRFPRLVGPLCLLVGFQIAGSFIGCASDSSANEQVASQPAMKATADQIAACGTLPAGYAASVKSMALSKMQQDGKIDSGQVGQVSITVGTPYRVRSSRGIFRADMWRYGWIVPVDAQWSDANAKSRTAIYVVFYGRDYPDGGIREGGIGPKYGNAIERLE